MYNLRNMLSKRCPVLNNNIKKNLNAILYLWNFLSLKKLLIELYVSLKRPICAILYLWIVLSMKRPICAILYLWIVLSMKCLIFECMFYEIEMLLYEMSQHQLRAQSKKEKVSVPSLALLYHFKTVSLMSWKIVLFPCTFLKIRSCCSKLFKLLKPLDFCKEWHLYLWGWKYLQILI